MCPPPYSRSNTPPHPLADRNDSHPHSRSTAVPKARAAARKSAVRNAPTAENKRRFFFEGAKMMKPRKKEKGKKTTNFFFLETSPVEAVKPNVILDLVHPLSQIISWNFFFISHIPNKDTHSVFLKKKKRLRQKTFFSPPKKKKDEVRKSPEKIFLAFWGRPPAVSKKK